MCNMVKVNNKDTKMALWASFWCLYCLNIFHTLFYCLIVLISLFNCRLGSFSKHLTLHFFYRAFFTLQSFFWYLFSRAQSEYGKCEPGKLPYSDIFHAVLVIIWAWLPQIAFFCKELGIYVGISKKKIG